MNVLDLFYKDDYNGETIYYIDDECTKAYTGHIEEYDRDILSIEADVVDGYMDGVCKEYYFLSNKLEIISQMKYNLQTGLSMEFYENGMVRSISIVIQNCDVDYITYNENGEIEEEVTWPDERKFPFVSDENIKQIQELRLKYNLKKIHEEIMREGSNFNYMKYFE